MTRVGRYKAAPGFRAWPLAGVKDGVGGLAGGPLHGSGCQVWQVLPSGVLKHRPLSRCDRVRSGILYNSGDNVTPGIVQVPSPIEFSIALGPVQFRG